AGGVFRDAAGAQRPAILGGEAAMKRFRAATDDPLLLRLALGILAMGFIALFLILPLLVVFSEALAKGVGPVLAALIDPDSLVAIRLSLVAAAIAVPLNTVFGIAAAWAVTKFDFPGKAFLVTL